MFVASVILFYNQAMNASSTVTQLRGMVSNYKMPDEARALLASSEFLVLCGVTAAGKNTIVNYLVEHDNFEFVVSHTTRKPRENHGVLEQNGKDYWFIDDVAMLDLVQNQQFVEVKAVHGDTFYGTSIMAIRHALTLGKRPTGEIDVQGAVELLEAARDLRPVFVLPPSYDTWMQRLGGRGSLSQGEKDRRFSSARNELELAISHPAFLLLANHAVEESAAEIMNGIVSDQSTQDARRELARELLSYLPAA